jgi:hypothetical protein
VLTSAMYPAKIRHHCKFAAKIMPNALKVGLAGEESHVAAAYDLIGRLDPSTGTQFASDAM